MAASPVIVSFLGGTSTVTGSKFLVESADARVLVDAGLFQGLKHLRLRNRAALPVAPSTIDAVLVTHAHLDHCGYLPVLVRDGFAGPVLCTQRTAELTEIVLSDSARLQEEEAEFANRKGFSKHRPAEPLYTQADAEKVLGRIETVAFGDVVEVVPGVDASFRRAGHILGSASVILEVGGADPVRVFVSGDVGRTDHPVLLAPDPPPAADALLVESTYGDRVHEPNDVAIERLAQAITRTAKRGGVVIIPSFAVDRTEIILLALARLADERRIPRLPTYADSPMALDVLNVYRTAIRARDSDVRLTPDDLRSLGRGAVHEARSRDESIALNGLHGPSIIISASGMATGGRVLHHLARALPDHRNTVILPGYQAEGTRGRQLANHVPMLKMLGRYVPVAAEIVTVDAFSAHADADALVAWLGGAPEPPGTAFVVHGEPDASGALRDRLQRDLGWNAVSPRPDERVIVTRA